MNNPEDKILMWRIAFWVAVAAVSLTVMLVPSDAKAESTLKLEDGVVSMSEEDFRKMAAYITNLETKLGEKIDIAHMYRHRYNDARTCVVDAVRTGKSAIACFYPAQEVM